MRIKLGDPEADQSLFKFKIGDEVRAKLSPATGTVLSGECYINIETNSIFYEIQTPDGRIWTARQEELESLDECDK
jgi:hypothetical protein